MKSLEPARLPHGPEFCFVDRVLARRPGRNVVGCLDLDTHTSRPTWTGALPPAYILEAMIQTCGLIFFAPSAGEAPGAPPMVVALDRVRWTEPQKARQTPERVVSRCRFLGRAGAFLRFRCIARAPDGRRLASGDVTLQAPAAPRDGEL